LLEKKEKGKKELRKLWKWKEEEADELNVLLMRE